MALLKLSKIAVLLLLFYFLSYSIYAANVKNVEARIIQTPNTRMLEITPEYIRKNWIFDVQIENPPRFIVMKNVKEWQDFWQTTLPIMKVPEWVEGDIAVFIFLGKNLPGGTKATLTTLNYQSEQNVATLFWKSARDLEAISVTAFQDVWTVFTLNPNSNPVFGKLNNIVRVD